MRILREEMGPNTAEPFRISPQIYYCAGREALCPTGWGFSHILESERARGVPNCIREVSGWRSAAYAGSNAFDADSARELLWKQGG